ncbi:Dehydroquinate synthase-like protein [Mollisia scopiformis]|uniref:Dehydroquinate synthase-like protein n=1 Tax=Mollisia scopiformis TaxID=149040 RepID=A0A132B369_MOLSC|nr:Dehydroquinate synthase-like protein [Mollisia scopiformis]KUJ06693.1 Dehydroquinate synthase-like protein [Mollisia scopiformis]
MAAQGETYRLAFPPNQKPYISTGLPFHKSLVHHVTNTFHASKVYVIVSASISKTSNFSRLQSELGNKIVGVRYGIKQHVPWTDVLEVVNDINQKEADLIVTLGAGSLTDGAKVIAFALANQAFTLENLAKIAADAKPIDLQPCSIPIINIPTSLSGGEYTASGGATDMRTHRKHSFAHPSIGTNLVILDPTLSISTPERVWISSGMRAVDHCVEGLCSNSPKVTDSTDATYTKGLRLLVPSLLRTKKDKENQEARLDEMLGVIESMKGSKAGVPMGGSHAIGHQLGPLRVGHGETSCVMLPHVLRWNHLNGDETVKSLQRKVCGVFWGQEDIERMLKSRGLEPGTVDASDIVGALVSELGMPRTLKEVNVSEDRLDALAANTMKDRWSPTNPVPLKDKSMVLEILRMALGT